jgi:hypothetical protein
LISARSFADTLCSVAPPMMLPANQSANAAEVLAAVAALRRFEAHVIGVGRGFVLYEALMRVIEISKSREDLLVQRPRG